MEEQPSKTNKKIYFGVFFILIIILIVVYFGFYRQPNQTEPLANNNVNANSVKEQINVVLAIKTGTVDYQFSEKIDKDSTVFDLMKLASAKENFDFVYKDSSLGAFVEEIYNLKNNQIKGYYWLYSVNGKDGEVGVAAYKLSEGDKVVWEFKEFVLK